MSDITAVACHQDEARKLWPRCLEGLADPAKHFGPDVEPDRVRADQFYRLVVDGDTIGLGWARRFTRLGSIMSYGKAFVAEARGRGLSRAVSAVLVTRIFADFPACSTVLAMIWGTNPHYPLGAPTFDGYRYHGIRQVGEIREALPTGESLYIVQILRSQAKAMSIERDPEEEWRGAPHAHRDMENG